MTLLLQILGCLMAAAILGFLVASIIKIVANYGEPEYVWLVIGITVLLLVVLIGYFML